MSLTSEAKLADLLVFSQLSVHSKKRVFESAAEAFCDVSGLSREAVYRGLLDREKLGSTALGDGVAIPHCRIDECNAPLGCLITLSNPIDFSSSDGQGVDIVLVLLVPSQAAKEHLDLLAGAATLLSNEQTRLAIREAVEPVDLTEIVVKSGLL
ncbi:MAG: PTS sugar transporter subunit IIA [Luminiphilus sp.]|jgi:PTS system nitrogen regulatory IIA component|nr:PTS fructose transporter subunit IIA [Halieaceae bacterium]MBL6699837.1 PTS sugar transporter subunit IIA [Luminiphilus sp.]MBL6897478.1 PTS sugar transporter subunit IIA [Luminiphilus sp.]MCH1581083.1 PTS sugar transporter subunit IIA [Luminiphilus sp.]MDA8554530.1 PTS sugar transporter subunit IIA [Luminiphilus sp.]